MQRSPYLSKFIARNKPWQQIPFCNIPIGGVCVEHAEGYSAVESGRLWIKVTESFVRCLRTQKYIEVPAMKLMASQGVRKVVPDSIIVQAGHAAEEIERYHTVKRDYAPVPKRKMIL